jgi:hypothetical protein
LKDSQETNAEEAARIGLNYDTLFKARVFADPVSGFTKPELTQLCKQVESFAGKFAERGTRFGFSHVILLLAAEKPDGGRAELQEQTFKNGWSKAELKAAILSRYGRRRQGGRKRRMGAREEDVILRLEMICESWRRLYAELARAKERGDDTVRLVDLPKSVWDGVTVAEGSLNRLHGVVTRYLTRKRREGPGAERETTT